MSTGRRTRSVAAGAGRSAATKNALVSAAVETVRREGFAGASARAIADRAGCNQALVFYHFGSVVGLLLAALDSVSAARADAYEQTLERAGSTGELIEAAARIFAEDLDAGHTAFLVQMIAGAASTPGLGPEIAARIAPWNDFARRAVRASGLLGASPPDELALLIVATHLGLELLAELDGDRGPALSLFDGAARLAGRRRSRAGSGERPPLP